MIESVYETVVYAEDVRDVASFYAETLGLRLVGEPDDLVASLRLPDGGMFLVFNPRLAAMPGRPVPSHGTSGAGHVAFAVRQDSLEDWVARLAESGTDVDRTVEWESGRSLYFRDPAGNSVELVDRDIWPV